MAKKGQPIQLQIEVNNDEEWEKLLLRDGLIIVDIYSEWCGPCLGMQANLKKLKLEHGGDLLQLSIAKSDGITSLARFRNKSEPTWMFLSKGKMIKLMFGADAPKLTRFILEELKKERQLAEGQPTDRTPMEVTDLADEERVRYDAAEAINKEVRDKEDKKKAKELLERRTAECENILTNLPNYGTALVFPSAKDKYKEVINEIIGEAGLTIQQTEKVNLNDETLDELCYFSKKSDEFSDSTLEEILNKESLIILLKIASKAEIEDIDEAILSMIYGSTKRPPGAHESVAQKLISVEEEDENEKEKDKTELVGIWTPLTPFIRATSLRIFFPKLSSEFVIPEPEPEPEHLAIVFTIGKKDEALQIMHQFPHEIMKQGIFTSENPEDTTLVAKTLKQWDKVDASQRTNSEKLVLQVSKQKSECILAFAQLSPVYMSPNAAEGKIECEKFFPEDYVVDEEVEEEEEEEEKSEGEETEGEPAEGEDVSEIQESDIQTEEAGEPIEGEGAESTQRDEGEEGADVPEADAIEITAEFPPPPAEEPVAAPEG